METYSSEESDIIIEIVHFYRLDFNTAKPCLVRENSAVYGEEINDTSSASIKEINGRKYVEVDLSAEIQEQLDKAVNADEQREIAFRYILNPFTNIEKMGPPSRESTIQAKSSTTWKKDPASTNNITDFPEKVNK